MNIKQNELTAADMAAQTGELSEQITQPISGSKKIYIEGSRSDIRVPMREIAVSDTATEQGVEKNMPITVYDTSGAYTDPNVDIDLMKGLAPLRENWIAERADTEQLDGPTSDFGQERLNDEKLDHLRFDHIRKPLRAKKGKNVTQMHYAKQGIITPEMEFIAIREDIRLQELRKNPDYEQLLRQHKGENFGASIPDTITPEFVRDEVAHGRAVITCLLYTSPSPRDRG